MKKGLNIFKWFVFCAVLMCLASVLLFEPQYVFVVFAGAIMTFLLMVVQKQLSMGLPYFCNWLSQDDNDMYAVVLTGLTSTGDAIVVLSRKPLEVCEPKKDFLCLLVDTSSLEEVAKTGFVYIEPGRREYSEKNFFLKAAVPRSELMGIAGRISVSA